MERNYKYSDNHDWVTVAQIERILLDYFDEEEIDNSGCSTWNGEWFSLETVMEAIRKGI